MASGFDDSEFGATGGFPRGRVRLHARRMDRTPETVGILVGPDADLSPRQEVATTYGSSTVGRGTNTVRRDGQLAGSQRGVVNAATASDQEQGQTSNVDAANSPQAQSNLQNTENELCTCTICSETMTGTILTRCGHRFCAHCIYNWLEQHPTCPHCRADVRRNELVQDTNFDALIAAVIQTETGENQTGQQRAAVLENMCRCLICAEIFNGSVVTWCGHRFCAHCIHNWILSRNNCPSCGGTVNDGQLITESSFDELTAVLQTHLVNERRQNSHVLQTQESRTGDTARINARIEPGRNEAVSRPLRRGESTVFEELSNCVICSEKLSETAMTRCGHRFCNRCIRQWLQRNRTCPVCRNNVRDAQLIRDHNYDEIIALLEAQLDNRPARPARTDELDYISGEIVSIREEATGFTGRVERAVVRLEEYAQMCRDKDTELERLRTENQTLQELSGECDELRQDNERLRDIEQLYLNTSTELERMKTAVLPGKQAELDQVGAVVLQLTVANKKQKEAMLAIESKYTTLMNSYKQSLANEQDLKVKLQPQAAEIRKLRDHTLSLEQQCCSMDEELQRLNGTVIPEKDAVIATEQNNNTLLQYKLAYITRNVRVLDDLVHSPLYLAARKLQTFYDQSYRTRINITPEMITRIHELLEVARSELENHDDLEKKVAEAVLTHISLIEENASLHDSASQLELEVGRLKSQLYHAFETQRRKMKREQRPEE